MKMLIPLLQKLFSWIVSKVLLALGLSFVTYTGITIASDKLKDALQNAISGIPSDAYALMTMAGFGNAIGIIFGAFAFNAAMSATSKLTAIGGASK